MTIKITKNNELKMTIPKHLASIKEDGTIWYNGYPVIGVKDPAEKKQIGDLVRAGKFSEIPAKYYTRMGDNENGLWAGTDAEWKKRDASRVIIYLSSRGWGDYSPLEIEIDINRPDCEIIAECKKALADGHDVDNRNQSDDEILAKIKAERERIATADEKEAARKRDLEKYEEHRAKMKRVMGY